MLWDLAPTPAKGKGHVGGEQESIVGWQSEQVVTLPSWAPGEGSVALLKCIHDELPAEPKFSSASESAEKEELCWWILSALEACDGKEAREEYYSRL